MPIDGLIVTAETASISEDDWHLRACSVPRLRGLVEVMALDGQYLVPRAGRREGP